MATKEKEACQKCNTKVSPTDKPIEVLDSSYGSYPVQLWRYQCSCGWIWANYAQRQHNHREWKKARKAHENEMMYGSWK